jgi:hypothetical protein
MAPTRFYLDSQISFLLIILVVKIKIGRISVETNLGAVISGAVTDLVVIARSDSDDVSAEAH